MAETRKVFVLTHNYTGNAMVRQARELVRTGVLGTIRKVLAEYPQGWLATPLEATRHKQAAWKTEPKRCGSSRCMSDIGTHAENLIRFVTGLQIDELCADLTTFLEGRRGVIGREVRSAAVTWHGRPAIPFYTSRRGCIETRVARSGHSRGLQPT
ncbi:MAG: Gfo/Idh/MocA family protein, partial [Opitutaceae bacterium]